MATRMRTTLLRVAVLAGLALASPVSAQNIGPSTTTEPYLLPSPALPPGTVSTTSILTAGDSVDGYRMVGVPDGLGAFKDRRHTFTVLSNHELGATQGAVRSHGSTGAFVSRWTIDRKTLEVHTGQDQIKSPNAVFTWDPVGGSYVKGTTAFERFCSADLPDKGAFSYGNLGTDERIYLNGEETRPPFTASHGRAWAHIVTGPNAGQVWQLPRLGQMSFENQLASPHPQRKTVVMLMDDAAASTAGTPLCETVGCPSPQTVPSELYVYVGTKQRHGSEIERAGLTNGTLYGVKVLVGGALRTEESNSFGLGTVAYVGSGRFALVNLGDQSSKDGIELQQDSVANNVFRMQRVEDGAWDPRSHRQDDFYFVTTASVTTNSRLWRLRFDDIERPELGGTIEILLKGDEGHRMLDNLTIDRLGRVLVQEDVGNNVRLGKIWLYGIETKEFIEVAAHDPKFFLAGGSSFLTQDEESSGIIDAGHVLGKGWFLLDVQAHFGNGPELVEGGQYLALWVDPKLGVPQHDHHHDEDEDEDDD